MTDRQRLIELALSGLESERDRISQEITQLQHQLRGGRPGRARAASADGPAPGSRTMSAAQKRKIAASLRKRWAERRKGQAGSNAKPAARAGSPNKGKAMTTAQKRKISDALKKRWAERKKAQKAA